MTIAQFSVMILGILALGWIGTYVQEIIDGQRPNPFSRKNKKTGEEQKKGRRIPQ